MLRNHRAEKKLVGQRTWLEISKPALLNNISEIKKQLSPRNKFMAVIKANAYGHGLLEVAKIIQNKVDYLAVFDFNDALLLRKKGIKKPLLALSRIFSNQVDLAIKNDIEVTISTFDIFPKIKKGLKFHICFDTGMGRDGLTFADTKKLINLLKKSPAKLCGIYAHFAAADEKNFDDYTAKQVEGLIKFKKELLSAKIELPLIHHDASAGAIYHQNHDDFNLTRIGVALYGLWPSSQRNESINLQPVLSWRAKISEIRFLPKGSSISYGCTHKLSRDSKLAVVPIGYYDGIFRLSSNKSFAILRGKKIPQIGRVTMNMMVFDVTDVQGAKVDDVVTIIGKDGEEEITADNWAAWAQTINYEVVTRLNPALIRVQS